MNRNPTPLDDLRYIDQHIDEARRRLRDQRRGHPASSFGAGGTGGTNASPVEAALGLNGPTGTIPPDQAQGLLDELDRLERTTRDTLARMRTIVATQLPKPPTSKQRAEVDRANNPDPTCEHCTPHRPTGRVELVHRTGDVTGNLDRPMALCRWCYDVVRRTGQLPGKAAIARHTLDLKPLRVHG